MQSCLTRALPASKCSYQSIFLLKNKKITCKALNTIVAIVMVFVFSLPCLASSGVAPEKTAVTGKKNVVLPTADHRKFKQLKEGFERGPEVTKACLTCHTEAAKQVQNTIHWTWSRKEKEKGKIHEMGKAYTLNSF